MALVRGGYTNAAMARDLVHDSFRAMQALQSVRIDCEATIRGEIDPNPVTTSFTLVLVGEDCYQNGDIDQGGEVVFHVRSILGEPREYLFSKGVEYVRDPRYGDWLRMLPNAKLEHGYSGTFGSVEGGDEGGPAVAPLSVEEYRKRYLLFGIEPDRMRDYSIVGTEDLDGSSLVHVRGLHSQTLPSPIPNMDDFEKSTIMTPDTRENLVKMLNKMPNHARGTLNLWIDQGSQLIQRLEWLDEGLRDDQIVSTHQGTRLYSLFNTAEIPVPLPN